VDVPVWLGLALTTSVRLRGIDTPEIRGDCQRETDLAAEARERLVRETTPQVTLRNIEGDKYFGRVEADVTTVPDGLSLREAMLASGLARPYEGGKRGDWCGLASLTMRAGANRRAGRARGALHPGEEATGRRTARMKVLDIITLILVIIGGINWGLVGLFDWNLVHAIFAFSPIIEKIVYIVVGLSGLWQIMPLARSMQS
jgi:uncharacterized membrane protein YuzA (DUF378 family)